MISQTNHFRVSVSAHDRFKIPNSFWVGLKSLGISSGAVMRQCNLPIGRFGSEHAWVSTAQFFAIWRSITVLSADSDIGWKIASCVEPTQYHPVMVAALHARTYQDALERMGRYKQLCCAEEMRIRRQDNECIVDCNWPFAEEVVPPRLTDAVFAAIIEIGRRGTRRNLEPKRIELRRAPEPGSGLKEYFRCPIKYRAARDAIVLRSAELELPFVTHNDEMLEMLTPQLDRELERGRPGASTLDHVKWVLRRLLSGSRPDIHLVAKELGMSGRTLQRRITEEGSSFRQLLNETRHEMVRQYLRDPNIEINEAAFLLGYEDPNSFYRAFRTWEGTTPAHWRLANASAPHQKS